MANGSPDCIVIGGGIIGLSAALALADRGVKVTVLERGEPGGESSWAAAGLLAPQAEAHGDGVLFELLHRGRQRWPEFARALEARSGVAIGYRAEGSYMVAFDHAEAERLEARARWQRKAGLAVEMLDGDALAKRAPALAPATLALFLPHDHQVDPRRLIGALVTASSRAGAKIERAEVRALRRDGARVSGVLTDLGPTHAGAVVLAAGAWSGLVEGAPLSTAQVVPVRGQMIAFDAASVALDQVVFGDGGYLVPRAGGRILCGSTEEQVGFNKEITEPGIYGLRMRAARLCPALAGLPMVERWCGLRPASADALPYLGATALGGLYAATGHFRNGVLLAPLTAEIMAALVTGGTVPVDISALSPARA
jgi:glycine oxidase